MKYTILTLGNPERTEHRNNIRNAMVSHEEVFIECVNGKNETQLNHHIETCGYRIKFENDEWRPGEAGVWYSNINAWKYAAEHKSDLLVFEDDAVIETHFRYVLRHLKVPPTADFVSLYIPFVNTFQKLRFDIAPVVEQEHGNVCILYTAKGAKKMLDILSEEGIEWPVDIWLFKKAHSRQLIGYQPRLMSYRIVSVDFEVPTNIHDDDRIKVRQPNAV